MFRDCCYKERGKGCGSRAATGRRDQRHRAHLLQAFSVPITEIINGISGQLPD